MKEKESGCFSILCHRHVNCRPKKVKINENLLLGIKDQTVQFGKKRRGGRGEGRKNLKVFLIAPFFEVTFVYPAVLENELPAVPQATENNKSLGVD